MKELVQTNEGVMKDAFCAQTADILACPDRFRKPPGILRVGLEMEAGIMGTGGRPATEAERNTVISGIPFADVELGASQLEWRTEPIVINKGPGLGEMIAQAVDRDHVMSEAAAAQGLHILRAGTNPFIAIPEIVRTDKKKYQMVPDFHNAHRLRTDTVIGENEPVDVGDAAVVSLLNSLQCNTEAESLQGAVNLLNRSLMIGPMVVALSGNARFLSGADTGFADVRMSAWETSHDVRTEEERNNGKALRVGLPSDYFTDAQDYFDRVGSHPFILEDPEHALQIGIGLFWNDARIKIIGDSAVVEFRPVSIQPSVEEDLAIMMFYLGRLMWSTQQQEPLVPMSEVRERRAAAMMQGIAPFQGELPAELSRAKEGLLNAGVPAGLTDGLFFLLEERVTNGKTPADTSADKFQDRLTRNGGDRNEALIHAFDNLV